MTIKTGSTAFHDNHLKARLLSKPAVLYEQTVRHDFAIYPYS